MELNNTQSLWRDTAQLPQFETLNEDKTTDVLIIGGGIAGILTALLLHDSGIDYMLVEKNRICSENTQNTTAKITAQHGLVYQKIEKQYGLDTARLYWEINSAALEKYAKLCQNKDCDFERKDNYVYSVNRRDKLEKEMRVLEQISSGAVFCENPSVPIDTVGAVKISNQAQFHPLKFINSVCRDLHIYEHTFVREMIGNTAKTDRCTIKANKVIVATHFPFINKHGLYPLKMYQHRSYVIALENACEVDGMYVDESDTGMSFRNHKQMLLIGGGDHRTGKKGGNWEELRSFSEKTFPDCVPRYQWAAQDCMSLDSMPYIGRYSQSTHDLYVASGFNKWGMTGAMIAATVLSDTVKGIDNKYASVFNPSRTMLHPQLFINILESAVNLLSFSTKRCPHLGCALHWNHAEHSWDCACHGSRFTETGKVINNPANGNLKK
jgi:glycine/D-amino acid oxidase-like deaminating enzyme